MRKQMLVGVAGLLLMGLGCTGDGLSPHEDSTSSLPAVVYQQPGPGPAGVNVPSSVDRAATKVEVAKAPKVDLPMRAGIVQIGEVAPPETMMNGFRDHPELFSQAEPLPGIFRIGDDPNDRAKAQENLLAMRKAAGSMGLKYLMVYGGTVNQTQRSTALYLFDFTIIGAFVVPSEAIHADGKAVGSLIDVSSGEVVMTVSVDAKGDTLQTAMLASRVRESVVNGVRLQLIDKMTQQTIDRLGEMRVKTAAGLGGK